MVCVYQKSQSDGVFAHADLAAAAATPQMLCLSSVVDVLANNLSVPQWFEL